MTVPIWDRCLLQLEGELSEQQLNTWIRPLQASESDSHLSIMAPNQFVLNTVESQYFTRIKEIAGLLSDTEDMSVELGIGSSGLNGKFGRSNAAAANGSHGAQVSGSASVMAPAPSEDNVTTIRRANLNPSFNFDNFVEGKSNQLGRAAALQIGQNPGKSYNPFFICGASGLGKTHLLHSVGNSIIQHNPKAKVMYLNSERYVAEMVSALQRNTINEFKRFYRSLDALLIDDIQFFAGKDRTQEEFFHTFNALFEGGSQVILTCDRYPKEVEGLEERLKSRFQWGLTVAVEPPELETRVAILHSKAERSGIELPSEVSFFIAKRIRSNVRELEGALRRVVANAEFTGKPVTLEFAREALRDLIAVQNKMVSIENIQKTVAEYYNIRLSDLSAKTRSRSIARPRQIAMSLSKELTSKSLPEIGQAFGGRDHTTVLHACRKINELKQQDPVVQEDYANLLRTLSV
ncbi:MAG: chromosomal replication initiator protein DnaA [Gammaproteobacteria bacterium]|nr:chromosomal replication initiator protein DnaA [Gammaproteobacteria bacterium]